MAALAPPQHFLVPAPVTIQLSFLYLMYSANAVYSFILTSLLTLSLSNTKILELSLNENNAYIS